MGATGTDRQDRRLAAQLALAGAGLALIAAAVLASGAWIDRHVLVPLYFGLGLPGRLTGLARAVVAAVGLLLITVVRPRVARRPRAGSLAGVLVAVVASVVVVEGLLRLMSPAPASGSPRYELKVGERHPRFGWISRPSRTTVMSARGRHYSYAVNGLGLRARSETALPDLSRPALVMTGESIANGFGLAYDETFAALCGRDLGLEVVNVAEGGYGLDQAYLRLADILPRVPRPAVVVFVVVGPELGRMARDDRPRLVLGDDGAPALVPRATGFLANTRLYDVFHNQLAFVSERSLQRSLRLAAALLRATARMAAERGARPLFVIPSVGPPRPLEQHRERDVVQTLFVRQGLPFVLVDLPRDELLPGDYHPNPAGARRIATAIEAALQPAAPLQARAPR